MASNAVYTNQNNPAMLGVRGYATLHESQNGERFTIFDVEGVDMYCYDWEVALDKEASRARSRVEIYGRESW